MTLDPIYILVCVLFVLNLLASIYIATRKGLERFQIVGQIVIIWLIPFFASIGLCLLYRSQEKPSRIAGSVNEGGSNPIGY